MTHKAIVMEAAANMPSSCKGRYKRVAVVVIDSDVLRDFDRAFPHCISARARGVVRIVRTWEKLNAGSTDRCAYRRALDEAERLAEQVNEELEGNQEGQNATH
jgi:hypothetical protein